MELRLYLDILRRRWWIVAGLPLLVALISGAVAAVHPARYGLTTRLLVTRAAASDGGVGLSDRGEDKTALDLPAIVESATFRRDLAEELARRGRPIDEHALVGALRASTQDRVVVIAVEAAGPDDAVAIGEATVGLVQRNGLRYWGDPHATPASPGLDVGVLDPPQQAARLNGPRAIALEVGLRALLALAAAVGLVFALHYLDAGRRAQGAGRRAQNQRPAADVQSKL